MHRPGHLLLTLRPGERLPAAPSQLDHLLGAGRPASALGGHPVERVLTRWGDGFRCVGVYHARRSLGRVGEQHLGFDDLEEQLGLSRTYRVQLASPARTRPAVAALRDLAQVESAVVQTLAAVPFAPAPAPAPTAGRAGTRAWGRDEALRPHRLVRAAEALAIEPGSETVTVGIVDTGVSLGHPELQRKLLAGFDTVDLGLGEASAGVRLIGDSRGADFTPRDEVFHGSHCAGVVGAQGWRIPRGLAGRSLILPIRVLAAAVLDGLPRGNPPRRTGVGCLPDIDAGMKVCVDLGADVINMSFGTPETAVDPNGPPPHQAVVAYATRCGCVLVAAAGNSGLEQRFFPAALPEVIAVGSVHAHGRRSAFSTFGRHLALCAPGEGIVSLGREGYAASTGTSHAAPFVAGAAALLRARAERRGRHLSGADVRRILTASARPLGAGGFSPETGHGLLDAEAALRHLDQLLADGRPIGRPA